MNIDILDSGKNKVGDVELDPSIFGTEVKKGLLHDMVVSQMASRRAGTKSTKFRHEVRGGGAKPWAQKGTGRARAGSKRSPIFRGGGVTFAPKPRDYSFKLPKKARAAALRCALSAKITDKAVMIIDKFELSEPKTKQAVAALSALELAGKTLIVLDEPNKNVALGFRNIPSVKLIHAQGVNVYDLLYADHVLMTEESLAAIQERLKK